MRRGPPRRHTAISIAAMAAASMMTLDASAVTRIWTFNGDGSWSEAAKWTGGALPASGDFASITNNDAISRNVALNINVNLGVAELYIANAGAGANTLAQTLPFNISAFGERVGFGSSGKGIHTQSAGVNSYSAFLSVGDGTSSMGVYTLSGSSTITVNGNNGGALYVGTFGSGTMNQNGGGVTVGSAGLPVPLFIGYGGALVGTSTGFGTYNLASGTLTVNGEEFIGSNGAGTFVQSGGVHNAGLSATLPLHLGLNFLSTGYYKLTGGALASSFLLVGEQGSGTFEQSGGTNTITNPAGSGQIVLGDSTLSTGTYFLSGTGAVTCNGPVLVGNHGDGTFNQSGGSLDVGGFANQANAYLLVGGFASSKGTYLLRDDASLSVRGLELIGPRGPGTFNQSGGTHTVGSVAVPSHLSTGEFAGGMGTYLMSGGVLTVNGYEHIGNGGAGTFIQSGGIHAIASQLTLANGTNTFGTYALDNGTLTVGAEEFIGFSGNGTFSQSGGTHAIGSEAAPHAFYVGFGTPGRGSYVLSAGQLSVSGLEFIGNQGFGTFAQSGGVHTIGSAPAPAALVIANLAGGGGTYSLSGTGLATVYGTVVVGATGAPGILNISGGSMNVTGTVHVADQSTTAVTLVGGTLTVGSLDLASNPSRFQFAAGTLIFSNSLSLTATTLSPAAANLTPAKTLVVAGTTSGNGVLPIALNGGVFSTGTMTSATLLQFNTGTFRLTNTALVIGQSGLFGAALQLNSSQHVEVTNGLVAVEPGALVYLPGGSLVGSAGITNSGQIELASPIALLSGGELVNSGTISGTGHVSNPLSNLALGTVEALGTDRLGFTGSNNSNDGHINALNGAKISFDASLINSVTGIINVRGILSASAGLTNDGQMQFSAGVADVFGGVTNNGRMTVTGGSTTTFYDSVNTAPGSITVNTNSTVVFLADIVGQTKISGPGTKDFEAGASGGPIATVVGDTIVGPAGNVATDYIREDDVQIFGHATVLPDDSAGRVSRINSLLIAGGTLDLTDNDLIANNTPLSTIAAYIKSAYNNGDWQGGGLTSSSAAAIAADVSNSHKTALGYAAASSIGASAFDGQTVGGANVLVRYTWSGDANLDGRVNALDFNALASNYGRASGNFWSDADFNYDGAIDTRDFNELAINFGVAPLQSTDALGSLVPEPALLNAALLSCGAFLRRTRRFTSSHTESA